MLVSFFIISDSLQIQPINFWKLPSIWIFEKKIPELSLLMPLLGVLELTKFKGVSMLQVSLGEITVQYD